MGKERIKSIAFCCLVLLVHQAFAQTDAAAPNIELGGFTQVTMTQSEDHEAFIFGFDRVRLSAKGKLNEFMDYKLQVDFMKQTTDIDKDGDTPGLIKDAVLTFKPGTMLGIFVGKFKTPVGMEFNTSGKKLDFVKRGLGQALIFERNTGAMFQMNKIGGPGFGCAAGIFNYGPNGANNTGNPAEGHDYTVAGSLSIDPQKDNHLEIFFGSALTSSQGQKNIHVLGAGIRSKIIQRLHLKGEFISRNDEQNGASDGSDFYAQSGFLLNRMFELAIKYEKLDVSDHSKDQKNITLGVNLFLNSEMHEQARIQVNYVISDLNGKDAFQVMFQGAF